MSLSESSREAAGAVHTYPVWANQLRGGWRWSALAAGAGGGAFLQLRPAHRWRGCWPVKPHPPGHWPLTSQWRDIIGNHRNNRTVWAIGWSVGQRLCFLSILTHLFTCFVSYSFILAFGLFESCCKKLTEPESRRHLLSLPGQVRWDDVTRVFCVLHVKVRVYDYVVFMSKI